MAKIYKKPVVSIDTGLSEGVYTATTESPIILGFHIHHGTSIDALKMTGYTYSVN